jgi:hypothetical protein
VNLPTPQLARAVDVAEQLGESLHTLRQAIRHGRLDTSHLDDAAGAPIRVSEAELDRLTADSESQA